ncbi:hypothetical protein KCU83_g238, partial [Aureobasidium melanogenum]
MVAAPSVLMSNLCRFHAVYRARNDTSSSLRLSRITSIHVHVRVRLRTKLKAAALLRACFQSFGHINSAISSTNLESHVSSASCSIWGHLHDLHILHTPGINQTLRICLRAFGMSIVNAAPAANAFAVAIMCFIGAFTFLSQYSRQSSSSRHTRGCEEAERDDDLGLLLLNLECGEVIVVPSVMVPKSETPSGSSVKDPMESLMMRQPLVRRDDLLVRRFELLSPAALSVQVWGSMETLPELSLFVGQPRPTAGNLSYVKDRHMEVVKVTSNSFTQAAWVS